VLHLALREYRARLSSTKVFCSESHADVSPNARRVSMAINRLSPRE